MEEAWMTSEIKTTLNVQIYRITVRKSSMDLELMYVQTKPLL